MGSLGGLVLDFIGGIVGIVIVKLDVIKIFVVVGSLLENVNFVVKGDVFKVFMKCVYLVFFYVEIKNEFIVFDVVIVVEKFIV